MRLLSYSSGYEICGIADYNRHLMPELARVMDADTVRYPVERASRDQLGKLRALRHRFTDLAARSADYDVALVHWVTRFFNGSRPLENMFPAFLDRLRRPAILVLHEWPTVPAVHRYQGPLLARAAKRALTAAWLAHDVRRLDYVRWLERDMFHRVARIVVHTPELRDRLVAAAVPAERISVQRFPLHDLPAPAATPDEVRARFGLAGKRVLLLLGYPAERKGFELAVRALSRLPEDVVILLVSPQRDPEQAARVGALQRLAAEHGVSRRLLVSDFLPDAELSAVFRVVDIAMSPFLSVTGSSSLAHFLAAGVPVVASDLPPIRLAFDAGAGIALTPAGNGEALAAVLAATLDPGTLADLRSRNAGYAQSTSFAQLARTVRDLAAEVAR